MVRDSQSETVNKGSLANMAVALILVIGALVFIWGGMYFYTKNTRGKNLDLYRDRQHAVIYVLYDLFATVKERYGEAGMGFLQQQIVSQASMLTPQSWSDDSFPKKRADLVGYGNAIIMHNGRVVYVNGEFRDYFKPAQGQLKPVEPSLRIFLDRMHRDLNSTNKEQSYKTVSFDIADRAHLFTGARFKLNGDDVVFVMHAPQEDILRNYGYYARIRDYTILCVGISILLLILGAILITGILREARTNKRMHQATERLEKEVAERIALTGELLKFKTMADTANAGMVIADLQGRLVYVNETFARMHGYEAADMLGMPAATLFPGETGDSLQQISRQFVSAGVVAPVELWPRRKDGAQFSAIVAGAAIPGPQGKPAWFAAVAIDNTERRNALRALRVGEEKYKGIFDESVAAVFVLDADKNFTDANRAALDLLGYSRQELLGMNFLEVLPEPGALRLALQQLMAGGRILNFEHAMQRKNGRCATVLNNSRPLTDEFGSVRGILATVVDITERRIIQEKLQRNQERYQRLVENLKDEYFFYSHGTDGVFTYLSPSVTSILGYTTREFMTHYTEYLAEGLNLNDVIRFTELSIEGVEQPSYEVNLRHKDGSIHTIEVKEYPVFDDSGNVVGVEGLAHDTTEKKRVEAEREALQEQLLQSQKMEAIGQLAGGIAHDFNNILAVMLGTSELVMRNLSIDDPNRDRVLKILESGSRAKDLTQQMLTFARKDKLHVQSVPVNEITQELTEMLRRSISKKITINTQFSPEPATVTVDVNQVIQALLNICINACDAMGKTGALSIATSEEAIGETVAKSIPGAKPGVYGVVTVRDSGPGIQEPIRSRIFEPFFTTKARGKGTGLGLSVTLGIIKNHEGFITVDTEQGRGTCFKIFLPLGAESGRIAPRSFDSSQSKKGSATVLLIDDNKEFLQMAEDILTLLGYTALKASSGREALTIYGELNGNVDLVLLDMMMPEMDGSDVFDALIDVDPKIKIILCSGYSLEGVAGRLLRGGAAAFLQKPFDIKEFSEILSHVIST